VGCVPVNVLPKTNSLGGMSSLGVVVLVIDNLEGSMSWSFGVDADWVWVLYDLEASQAATSFDGDCFKKAVLGRN